MADRNAIVAAAPAKGFDRLRLTLGGRGATLLLLAVATLLVRGATFDNPFLGFDEQFYLLVGDRMLDGALPYVDIFDRKPIGLFLIYAGIRLLGGAGFVQYKLVASLFVTFTAFRIQRIARPLASPFAAIAAALAYILWLNLMEGEGGQSPIFYNLPMIEAAALVIATGPATRRFVLRGAVAMLLVGIALQIKYSVALEGIAFGCGLIWHSRRRGASWRVTGACAALWIGCAALPTLLAFGYYAAIGHAREFLFCNFLSVAGQHRRPWFTEIAGLATILGILSPLIAGLALPRRGHAARPSAAPGDNLLRAWLMTSAASLVIYWRFDSPHYAIPVLLPLVIRLADRLDGGLPRRRLVVAALGLIFLAGQMVLICEVRFKGGAADAAAIAAAAKPGGRCLYVFDGPPALYMLTHSCLPSRWIFPGHLNSVDEADRAALGVDPAGEIGRILATRPAVIVDTYPRFAFRNPIDAAILADRLNREYRLAACIATASRRMRLIYRLREGPSGGQSDACHVPTT